VQTQIKSLSHVNILLRIPRVGLGTRLLVRCALTKQRQSFSTLRRPIVVKQFFLFFLFFIFFY